MPLDPPNPQSRLLWRYLVIVENALYTFLYPLPTKESIISVVVIREKKIAQPFLANWLSVRQRA